MPRQGESPVGAPPGSLRIGMRLWLTAAFAAVSLITAAAVYTFGDSVLDCGGYNEAGVTPGGLLVRNDDRRFPEFRGQGLTRSFLGALRRHVQEIGVRDVHLRVYAHDSGARRTFVDEGAGIDEVHLRKDLT